LKGLLKHINCTEDLFHMNAYIGKRIPLAGVPTRTERCGSALTPRARSSTRTARPTRSITCMWSTEAFSHRAGR
jgi:hypothetical protein